MDMARRERVRHISEREVGILDMSIQGIIRQSFHSRPRPRFPISSPKNQNPALPASSQSLCVFSVVAWRGAAVSGELDSWVGGFFFSFSFSFVGGCLFRIYVKLKLSVWSKDRPVCAYLIWSHAIV